MEACSGLAAVVPEVSPGPVFAFFRRYGRPGRAAGSVTQRAPNGKPAAMMAETAFLMVFMFLMPPSCDLARARLASVWLDGPRVERRERGLGRHLPGWAGAARGSFREDRPHPLLGGVHGRQRRPCHLGSLP